MSKLMKVRVEEKLAELGHLMSIHLEAPGLSKPMHMKALSELHTWNPPGAEIESLWRAIDFVAEKDWGSESMVQRILPLKSLFPPELVSEMTGVCGEVEHLQILSNEYWMPWELLPLGMDSDKRWRFLGQACALARTLSNGKAAPELVQCGGMAVISCGRLAPLFGSCATKAGFDLPPVEDLGNDWNQVRKKLMTGDYGVWHFRLPISADESACWPRPAQLGFGEQLREALLYELGEILARKRPLVFFEVPESARLHKTIHSQLQGWAVQFLSLGASAFVGNYWPVQDKSRDWFCKVFYEYFFAGASFGEALQQARNLLWCKNDISGLSYAGFGWAKLRLEGRMPLVLDRGGQGSGSNNASHDDLLVQRPLSPEYREVDKSVVGRVEGEKWKMTNVNIVSNTPGSFIGNVEFGTIEMENGSFSGIENHKVKEERK